ncbi:cytochrome c biogenesis protein ResB [Halalkalibacter okhensis]|uniref:Cytochrome C biogenesis protein n=1 Tax=Halalkalibacter okhensis TaxID=333138 RepID=A0A0B0IDH0_9BACI|nr:cytochrome c biogenesis protein ResB [Halalkalibacter okhensis]KHF38882.1 cytochrome C biogenesis protein [Halalkalibacter okhensis]
MSKLTCECGHVNPRGTIACESCGKPLAANDNQEKLLDMKYEGVARRSQTYTTTMIDKVWMFFSSVKVGIWIIVITLLASSIGTIYPQEMYIPPTVSPVDYYADEYGLAGQLYYQLGFHNLYSSWWYMLLIASLGVSILIASIDRFFPLYRALKKQRVTKHANFLKRQRIFGTSEVEDVDQKFNVVKERLIEKKYNVKEENGNLLAEKNRFARWGPYVNHIGLIIFLIGCMLRYFPGMYVDEHMWIREGETTVVPTTGGQYHIGNEQFIIELYDEEDEVFGEAMQRAGGPVVRTYQTNAVLYERENTGAVGAEGDLVEVDRKEIRVNEPMKFDSFALYQVDYKLHELNSMTFTLEEKDTGETFGEITVDLFDPQPTYDLGDGYRIEIREYFPDFVMSSSNVPSTRSQIPDNPVFIFDMYTPETPEGEVSFVGIRTNLEPMGENDYKMTFVDVDTKHVSALIVRKDFTLPLLIIGGIIFMIGLVQGSYWAHRRIWFQQIDGKVWIAGHTNKNYLALRKDIDFSIDNTSISSPKDQLVEDEKDKN